ncbi:hypothetical protein L1887_02862 [Cichorium endivia]|nr:hypothetical protein L1887_02862 [Cichorium endivia]
MTMDLPADILFYNILPRLPAKSASRFRCVSKQWNSVLTTPVFLKMHLHQVTNEHPQNHQKLLLFSAKTKCAFHSIHCEALEDGLTASRFLPFVDNTSSSKYITILTSCNGLVCVGILASQSEYSDMILWNPLTGEYKRLSYPHYYKECYKVTGSASELYYSASDDDYKLLRVTKDRHAYIYSLKLNSWRELYSTDDLQRRPNLVWGASTLQNGKLYFIDEDVIKTRGQLSYSIIRFDTKTEKFTVETTPCFGDDTTMCLNSMLLHKDGKIHLCAIYKDKSTELGAKLWMLDGDGDGDWIEVATYDQIPRNFYVLKPLHLMKNGNWLTVCRSGCHVNELDPVRDFKKSSYSYTAHRIDSRKKGIYFETLESPNRR